LNFWASFFDKFCAFKPRFRTINAKIKIDVNKLFISFGFWLILLW
jgi:hypothetical protein